MINSMNQLLPFKTMDPHEYHMCVSNCMSLIGLKSHHALQVQDWDSMGPVSRFRWQKWLGEGKLSHRQHSKTPTPNPPLPSRRSGALQRTQRRLCSGHDRGWLITPPLYKNPINLRLIPTVCFWGRAGMSPAFWAFQNLCSGPLMVWPGLVSLADCRSHSSKSLITN